jgi:osmoprotectant transport system permease protein
MSSLANVVRWFLDPVHWSGSDGIPIRLVQHVQLSAECVLIGAAIALPAGILLGHYGRFGNLAMNISNIGRAIPSFGILVIAFQVFGLGDLPIIISLTALAIPPMVTNSYVALREVDADVKEAARGMGYRELAQVLRVELPLAVPIIMAGVRTSAVQVVATATLAALIAGGGFGRYVIDGLDQQNYTKLFAGAILVALLALATELALAAAERVMVPRGIRLQRVSLAHRATPFKVA